MAGKRIAVTGTPGVGKTAFCASSSFKSVTVLELAKKHDCLGDIDTTDGAAPIDITRLNSIVEWPNGDVVLIDGHLSHLLPVDAAIVIRCHPSTLTERLSKRDYSKEKIEENIECELIGVISAECLELPFIELDSGHQIESLIEDAEGWITDGFKPRRPNEGIDWIAQIHGED